MTDTPTRRHSRLGLFAPFALVLIALAGWTVWWFYLTTQVEQRLEAQAQNLRQSGWTVAYSGLATTGWPFRTRVQADNVAITAPSGHALSAPELVAEANAYNPTRWVMIATEGLVLTRAEKGKVALRGDALRASVSGLTQAWPNIAIELANPIFTAHDDAEEFPISRAGRIELYFRPHLGPAQGEAIQTTAAAGLAPGPDSVDVLFRLIDAEGRSGGPVEGMAQNGRLTAQIETVVSDASRLKGSDAAGPFAAWSQAGGRLLNVRGEMAAGESRALLSSDVLSADAEGRLQGTLSLNAQQPLAAIAGLAGSDSQSLNPAGVAGAAAASAARGLAEGVGQQGRGDIDLTLVFRDGRTFLGPFALAPAPKLF